MNKILLFSLICFMNIGVFAQTKAPSFLRFYKYSDMMQAPDGALKFGTYGFSSPSILNYLHDGDLQLSYSRLLDGNVNGEYSDYGRYGVFYGSPGFGFGAINTNFSNYNVTDYRYSLGFGNKTFGLGFGYGFVGGDKSLAGRSNSWQWSMLYRPSQHLSFSLDQTRSIDFDDYETVGQVAIRPIPEYPLALFADGALYMGHDENLRDLNSNNIKEHLRFSYGVSWEALDGVRLNGRMFSNPIIMGTEIKGDYFSVGLDLSLGTSGVSIATGNNPNTGGNNYASFSYRSGAIDRTIFDDFSFVPKMFYATFDLSGSIKYQRNIFFDNSKTLLGILEKLDNIKNNDAIKGIMINAVGMQANPSIAWEIREKIKEIKEANKKVVIFIERTDLEGYHFASVADKIIIDEMGTVTPSGYILGSSYYKNMLAKLNIGYEELRLYKYKSAAESFAREGFSEGNKEQLQALIDSWYDTSISEIAESRKKVSKEQVDSLVNNKLFYFANELKENDFVDKIGRWTDREDILESIDAKAFLLPGIVINERPEPMDDKWGGNSDGIAVIYAIGVCSMEGGINARKLVEDVKKAVKNDNIKAIVLRVDSPGGDALASEYIAKVIRDNKDKKPIIVSQGMLAASGGYWLSMDADKIFASPKTITGSIGVISAYIYDKGAASELGITTDKVQVGKYADLGYTWRDPFIGLGLPTRNLTTDERGQWEGTISTMYDEFITKVAAGRDKEKDAIHEIAQGRVWTGADGLKNGLVDKIGGLDHAIRLARKEAGFDEGELKKIYEYPTAKSFDIASLFSGVIGFNFTKTKEKIDLFKFSVNNNGLPMPLLPIDFWDYYVTE